MKLSGFILVAPLAALLISYSNATAIVPGKDNQDISASPEGEGKKPNTNAESDLKPGADKKSAAPTADDSAMDKGVNKMAGIDFAGVPQEIKDMLNNVPDEYLEQLRKKTYLQELEKARKPGKAGTVSYHYEDNSLEKPVFGLPRNTLEVSSQTIDLDTPLNLYYPEEVKLLKQLQREHQNGSDDNVRAAAGWSEENFQSVKSYRE